MRPFASSLTQALLWAPLLSIAVFQLRLSSVRFCSAEQAFRLTEWRTGAREYLVSPLLTKYAPFEAYARRRALLSEEGTLEGAEPPTWSDMRRNSLLDSGISGILTGGLLRGVKGAFSLVCVFIQFLKRCLSSRPLRHPVWLALRWCTLRISSIRLQRSEHHSPQIYFREARG